MSKVIIIGGGFAGISSAVYLVKSGFEVELFEASPKLGGRAYSFNDETTGDTIDNGQHLLMGCYKETLQFLKIIDAQKNILYQDRLRVNFVDKEKGIVPLESGKIFYPLNLLIGLLNFKAISLKERFEIIRFFAKLFVLKETGLDKTTVKEWLKSEGQSERTMKAFWEILVVGALNAGIDKASAKIFSDILKEMFFKGNKAATIIIPKTGLSQMYCDHACKFITKSSGKINLSSKIEMLHIEKNKIASIQVNGKNITDFDFVISSIPFYSLQKMLPADYANKMKLRLVSSPILTIHLWLNKNEFNEPFYGLIDSPVHWVFNHKKYITIVISNAESLIQLEKEDIYELVVKELEKYFRYFNKQQVYYFKVIKEKRATFIPENTILKLRPSVKTKISNFFLAGDWINTGLPATIEGAVKSGRHAAQSIFELQH